MTSTVTPDVIMGLGVTHERPRGPSGRSSKTRRAINFDSRGNNMASRRAYRNRGYRQNRAYYSTSKANLREATRHMSVYFDPFSKSTLIPRIPDGKAITSTGIQSRATFALDLDGTDGVGEFVLFPGMHTCALFNKNAAGPNTENSNMYYVKLDQINGGESFSDTGTSTNINQAGDSAVHKWRIVSCGVHFDLVNNAEENDGWWECVRAGTATDAKKYVFGADNLKLVGPCPVGEFGMASSVMANHPSYVSGAMRHIGQFKFQLLPEGNDHEFRDVRQDFNIPSSEYTKDSSPVNWTSQTGQQALGPLTSTTGTQTTATYIANTDSITAHDFIKSHLDFGYDSLFFRFHGRDGVTSSRLKVSVVLNTEIVYDERAPLSRFHQKTPKHPKMDKHKHTKSRKPTAETANTTKTK